MATFAAQALYNAGSFVGSAKAFRKRSRNGTPETTAVVPVAATVPANPPSPIMEYEHPAAHDMEENGYENNAPEDNGPEDNGPEDNGPEDNGPEDNGPEDNGPEDNGPEDNGLEDNGLEDNGPEDNGLEDNGLEDNGPEDNGPEDNGLEDNGPEDNGPEDNDREANDPEEDLPPAAVEDHVTRFIHKTINTEAKLAQRAQGTDAAAPHQKQIQQLQVNLDRYTTYVQGGRRGAKPTFQGPYAPTLNAGL